MRFYKIFTDLNTFWVARIMSKLNLQRNSGIFIIASGKACFNVEGRFVQSLHCGSVDGRVPSIGRESSVRHTISYSTKMARRNRQGVSVSTHHLLVQNLRMRRSIPPLSHTSPWHVNLLKPTGHVMHQQFNIQQL